MAVAVVRLNKQLIPLEVVVFLNNNLKKALSEKKGGGMRRGCEYIEVWQLRKGRTVLNHASYDHDSTTSDLTSLQLCHADIQRKGSRIKFE